MKKISKILWLLLLVLSLSRFCFAADDRGKDFQNVKKVPTIRGMIEEINADTGMIKVKPFGETTTKMVKVLPSTILYKKMKPHQVTPEQLKAKLSDFEKGDTIIATIEDGDSKIATAKKLWEMKGFLVYMGQINSEVTLAGTITEIDNTRKNITLKKLNSNDEVKIKVNDYSKIYVDENTGDLKKGDKIWTRLRWLGYEEDRPEVLNVQEMMDDKSYVLKTFMDKFGPVIAKGKVQAVDMNNKMIKIGEAEGSAKTVIFDKTTKWIPGSAKIKKPADFVDYKVYIFGKSTQDETKTATQIINSEAVSKLFNDIVTSDGLIGGEITLLAMGELISLDSSRVSVRVRGGEKEVSRIIPKTIFVSGGRKVSASRINSGDWVMVRGMAGPKGQPGVALMVVSFGKIRQLLDGMDK